MQKSQNIKKITHAKPQKNTFFLQKHPIFLILETFIEILFFIVLKIYSTGPKIGEIIRLGLEKIQKIYFYFFKKSL